MEKKYNLKILIILNILSFQIYANSFDKNCLNCHNQQKIPSQLIYKRYLLEYSSDRIIKEKMIEYLINPILDNSIMPRQFFLKFPMKDKLDITRDELKIGVDRFIDKFRLKIRIDE